MLDLPFNIPFLMVVTALATALMLHKASGNNNRVLWITGGWLALQAAVSLTGFYHNDFSLPPRFALLVGPPLIFIIALFFSSGGKNFLDNLDLKALTWLHIVRIPVEMCLLWLYREGQIPVEMTFEGRNFDILSGLSAPFVVWLAFSQNATARRGPLLLWNVVCLGLLLNIVGTAVASSPYFARSFGFESVNNAVFYFPFVWLPCLIVPIVFLAHVAAIRKLLNHKV